MGSCLARSQCASPTRSPRPTGRRGRHRTRPLQRFPSRRLDQTQRPGVRSPLPDRHHLRVFLARKDQRAASRAILSRDEVGWSETHSPPSDTSQSIRVDLSQIADPAAASNVFTRISIYV